MTIIATATQGPLDISGKVQIAVHDTGQSAALPDLPATP